MVYSQLLNTLLRLTLSGMSLYFTFKIFDEFKLLQNLHLYTLKSDCIPSLGPLGEVGANFHRQCLKKLKIKQSSPKINFESIKNRVLIDA